MIEIHAKIFVNARIFHTITKYIGSSLAKFFMLYLGVTDLKHIEYQE